MDDEIKKFVEADLKWADDDPPSRPEPPGKPSHGSELREWLRDIVIALIIAILALQFIKPVIVRESSMEPNFSESDYLFASKQSYGLLGGEPQMGDVIVFRSTLKDEEDHDKLLIKRIIGVPGDVIDVTGGKVYVNEQVIDDGYTKGQTTNGEIADLVVPADSYFCLGDNRLVSVDSRSEEVGFVRKEDIVGKVVFRLFPISEFGAIENPYEN